MYTQIKTQIRWKDKIPPCLSGAWEVSLDYGETWYTATQTEVDSLTTNEIVLWM